MKSVGYVLADFPVFSETFVGDEMRAMAKRGHKITPIVMHLSDGPAQEADRLLAKHARPLASASPLSALLTLLTPGKTFLSALSFLMSQKRLPKRSLLWNAMKVAAIARETECAHLHAHFSGGSTAHAIVAARWIGASVSFVCHGHDVYAEAEDLPLKLDAADATVAVCNDMTSYLSTLSPGTHIITVPCGSDSDAFLPVKDVEPLQRLLFIGRLVEQKGIDDLLTAISLTPSACIDIVGDGPLGSTLRSEAETLGLGERVRFLGARPREWILVNAPRYLGLVTPFKIAPDGSRDAGPMVVKEAMLMEMPVVGTRFMGLKETVTPETGFQCDPGDPASLAKAIESLLALDSDQRRAMGRRARQIVIDQFSLNAASRTLSNLFEGL